MRLSEFIEDLKEQFDLYGDVEVRLYGADDPEPLAWVENRRAGRSVWPARWGVIKVMWIE